MNQERIKEKQFDAFVSYKSESFYEVLKIVCFLKACNHNIWFDREQIKITENYKEIISKDMAKCHCLLLCLTREALESEQVKWEIELAQEYDLKIIAISLDGTYFDSKYNDVFKNNQVDNNYYYLSDFDRTPKLNEINKIISKIAGKEAKDYYVHMKEREESYRNYMISSLENISRDGIIKKAVSRCGFDTPIPDYIRATIEEELAEYKASLDMYIIEFINNKCTKNKVEEFLELNKNINLFDYLWDDYDHILATIQESVNSLGLNYYPERITKLYFDSILAFRNYIPIIRLLDISKNHSINQIVYSTARFIYDPRFIFSTNMSFFVSSENFMIDSVVIDGLNIYLENKRRLLVFAELPSIKDILLSYFASLDFDGFSKRNIKFYDLLKNYQIINLEGKIDAVYYYFVSELIEHGYEIKYLIKVIDYLEKIIFNESLIRINNCFEELLLEEIKEFNSFTVFLLKDYCYDNSDINKFLKKVKDVTNSLNLRIKCKNTPICK